tara:strand:+ start:415 stop:552 length:138 start_codon:yes stop_codon:yes gene_type:complete
MARLQDNSVKIVELVIEKSKNARFIDNNLLIENCSNGENIDEKKM